MSISGKLQNSKMLLGHWNEQHCLKFVMIWKMIQLNKRAFYLKVAVQGMHFSAPFCYKMKTCWRSFFGIAVLSGAGLNFTSGVCQVSGAVSWGMFPGVVSPLYTVWRGGRKTVQCVLPNTCFYGSLIHICYLWVLGWIQGRQKKSHWFLEAVQPHLVSLNIRGGGLFCPYK